jgi:RHS repeat-associated protein
MCSIYQKGTNQYYKLDTIDQDIIYAANQIMTDWFRRGTKRKSSELLHSIKRELWSYCTIPDTIFRDITYAAGQLIHINTTTVKPNVTMDLIAVSEVKVHQKLHLPKENGLLALVTVKKQACPDLKFSEGFNQQSMANYLYDAAGNVTYDPNKKVTFKYNYLNLPYQIIGSENDTMTFLYDASGGLLQRKYVLANSEISKIDYLKKLELKSGQIDAINHENGRFRKESSQWKYEYSIKDHLGNVRSVFEDGNNDGYISTTEIRQRNDYYAFGLEQKASHLGSQNNGDHANRYKYNGKELIKEMDLSLLHYGARLHDGALGRFLTVDAMSTEPEQVDKSPYAYGWNNPVRYNDPDGKCPRCVKALAKTLVKSVAKGKVDLGEIYDVAESVGTLLDGQLSMADAEAVFNLLSPVSSKEIKASKKLAEKALDKIDNVVDASRTTNKSKGGVYSLIEGDKIVRTGRTKDLKRREAQHASSEETEGLKFKTEYETDSYKEQRGLEKHLYDNNPQAQSSKGGLNKIKPVSEKNKNITIYENAAIDFLHKKGGS